MSKLVKSKQRVADHGEVFTSQREVNAMLDLVKQETERIDSRFLEPACGDGNFLAEILRRKLEVVSSKYRKNPLDYERHSVIAITSVYGVDLLEDNVVDCRNRLFKIWESEYQKICKNEINIECKEAVKYIINHNILCGDALTMKTSNGGPIIFPEWSFVSETMVKRRDFRFDVLLKENENEALYDTQLSLFSDDASYMDYWQIDPVSNEPIPKPVMEYPIENYRRLSKYGK